MGPGINTTNEAESGARSLRTLGLALALAGVVFNPWTAAWLLAQDGTLEPASQRTILVFDAVLVLAGAGTVAFRRPLASSFTDAEASLRRLFWFGAGLRVLVWVFLSPTNNDFHLEVAQFIVEHGRLAYSDELDNGWQPPLYYSLAAVVWWLSGSAKAVQLLSLAFSLINLRLIHGFVRDTVLLETARGRAHAMLLATCLPQFVLFSSYVSNDALAFLVGTGLVVTALRWLEAPSTKRLAGTAALLGVGLLTKGSFIAFVPALAALVVGAGYARRAPLPRILGELALGGLLAGAVGCYKFVENYIRFEKPIVSNDDLPQAWIAMQGGTYRGPSSLVDLDVVALVRSPFKEETTRHSIPLLFYGTFWYSLIQESNFTATRSGPLTVFPRTMYALGVLPTLLVVVGLLACAVRARWWRAASWDDGELRRRGGEALSVLALTANFGLVLAWGLKHDAWSFFQARLVFPAFLPLAVLLGIGAEVACAPRAFLERAAIFAHGMLAAVFVAYFAVEIGAQLVP